MVLKQVLEKLYGVKLTYEGRNSGSVLLGTFQNWKVAKIIRVDPSHVMGDYVVAEERLH